MTEGRVTTNAKYHSASTAEGSGEGVYLFNPTLQGVRNDITGKYGFTGGMPARETPGSYTNGTSARKIRIADDGRIFLSTMSKNICPLLEVPDLETLVSSNSNFTNAIAGAYNETENAWYNDSEYRGCPNLGMDVKGGGDNLRVLMLGGVGKYFSALTHSLSRTMEYPLGTYAEYDTDPVAVAHLNGAYSESPDYGNVAYDNRGGIWFVQFRSTLKESVPGMKYIAADGTEKYTDITVVRNGGGIRFNPTFTQVAISSGSGVFSIYDVTYADDNTPTLTERYKITSGMGSGINDFAWDVANNLYAVSNNGEKVKAFSIPRENSTVASSPAPEYDFEVLGGTTGIDNVTGSADKKASWSAYGSHGSITVTGCDAKKVEVYSTDGKLISKGKATVKVKTGVYIVRVSGKATKVAAF